MPHILLIFVIKIQMHMEIKEISIKYEILHEEELKEKECILIETAKKACLGSYSPYSNFKVGCGILMKNGKIIESNNQENIAYPSGLCAERVGLFYAKSTYPQTAIEMLAIAAKEANDFTRNPITPCGSCRQVMLEYATQQENPISLLLYGRCYIYKIHNVRELLPFQFDQQSFDL